MLQFRTIAAFAATLMLLSLTSPAFADSSGGSGGASGGSSSGAASGGGSAGGSSSGGTDPSPRNGDVSNTENGTTGPLGSARTLSTSTGVEAPERGRFGNTASYLGQPNVSLLYSLVDAGGGPRAFKTTVALDALAGEKASAEVESLRHKFGVDSYKSFTAVFDYVVSDSIGKLTLAKVPAPKNPEPGASDGQTLAVALYHAGVSPSSRIYNVEYMLDDLVSHPVHEKVMKDVDLKYGRQADANFHVVLQQELQDLRSLYGAW
jgi:hypothetical protein